MRRRVAAPSDTKTAAVVSYTYFSPASKYRRTPGKLISMNNNQAVSFDDELLILVDQQDNVIGYDTKSNVHLGDGKLHRAFSIFLFDRSGKVLLQRRSLDKPLWPMFWTNTCCSHPRKGESYQIATRRRLYEELGLKTDLSVVYQFSYDARFHDVGTERELCTVFIGIVDNDIDVSPNELEVSEINWMSPEEIDEAIQENPGQFTPWFLLEWARLDELKLRYPASLADRRTRLNITKTHFGQLRKVS